MGQKLSSDSEDAERDELRDGVSELPSYRPKTHRKHEFFISNGDLETAGDLDSILQAINISPSSQDENHDASNEVVAVEQEVERQEAIRRVMKARSHKFIHRLSVAYPEQEGDSLSMIRVSTMMQVVEFCDAETQMTMATINKYFSSLIQTSRTTANIKCMHGWVDSIKRSPFLREISLRKECSAEEMQRFCRIIKNDGFPELSCLKFIYIGDDNLQQILNALNTKISRSLRLSIVSPTFTAGLSIQSYYLPQRVCYAFAEAAESSLCHVLGQYQLSTSDIDGLESFYKTVDFSDFKRLYEITLTNCPLQRKGFELFLRSTWPEGKSAGELPPLRMLLVNGVQMHNTGLLSMSLIMERGAFASLETLNIASNKINYKGVQAFASALAHYTCPNLRVLDLSDNFISVGYLKTVFQAFQAGACPLLSEIEFNHTGVGADDLESFASYLLSPFAENLTRINIGNNPQITSSLATFFHALTHSTCSRIRSLLLEGISISSVEIEVFVDWLLSGKAAQLRAVVLRSNLLDAKAFYTLLKTLINPKCPRLEVVDFSSNLIGSFDEDEWLQLLTYDGEEVLFEQVDYSFNPLSDNDMRLLLMFMSRFSRLERTQKILFASNNITAETISYYLKAIPSGASCLHYLSVDSCSISGVGNYLYEFMNDDASRSLQTLCLRDCNLSYEDIHYLFNGLKQGMCSRLCTLKLDGNGNVDNAFVREFIEIYSSKKYIPNLTRLEVGYTSIDADGVLLFLEYFKSNPSIRLQYIDLTAIRLHSAEKEEFKEEMKASFCGYCSF